MLLLLAVLIFWYFDILFNNYSRFLQETVFPQFEFLRCTHAFFSSYFFSVSNRKSNLCDKITIENQLAIKTNQLTDL